MTTSRLWLDTDLHEFFRRQGYLYVPGLVAAEQCAHVLGQFADTVPEARVAAVSRAHWRTDAAHMRLPAVDQVLRSDGVLSLLRSLLGANVAFVTNRHDHITINAGMGKAGRLHRDILHWSRSLVSLVVYVNVPAGLGHENGTAVLPGSHVLPTLGRVNNGGTWLDQGPYAALAHQAVGVPAEIGAAVLMDGMTYHRAQTRLAENESGLERARVAISWACRAVDELRGDDLGGSVELLTGNDLYRGNDRHEIEDGARAGRPR